MGYASIGFSGYVQLSYSEIDSYMRCMKVDLSPTEIQIIRKLSLAYVEQSYDKSMLSQPPYVDEQLFKPTDLTQTLKDKFAVFAK